MEDRERLLGEIASDIKHIIATQERQDDRLDRHSDRLDGVEKFQYKIMGMAIVVPFTLALVGTILQILFS